MGFIISFLVSGVAVYITARLLPGISISSFTTAVLVALVLGVLNAVIKPVLTIITFPVTLLTLGLFTFVISGVVVILASMLVPGFRIENFLWAILFSLVLSIISGILHALVP